ncbi:MAG: succinate dehydrogenase, hydrophobic membrane anchor protein [Rhodobacteraceae bacterium]|nr:succinate dehydrogenase, hydrophobic membrane anchor protein [Paracoccaceae bacterium]
MSYKTDYARVHGLGSAKSGTEHFIVQRLTAIALVPLVLAFLLPFAHALGAGHAATLAIYRNPVNAIIALATMIAVFQHVRLGVQVVIEDYVPAGRHRLRWLVANALVWRALMLAGIFAVLKIALGA